MKFNVTEMKEELKHLQGKEVKLSKLFESNQVCFDMVEKVLIKNQLESMRSHIEFLYALTVYEQEK